MRICAMWLIAVLCFNFSTGAPALAQEKGTDVNGRVLDSGTGLPIPNAAVDLDQATKRIAETKTAPDGTFSFKNQPEGIYNLLITASGYDRTRSSDLVLTMAQSAYQVQLALQRSSLNRDLRTIATVQVGGRQGLQTSTTINRSVDPALLQAQNYVRVGDALGSVPGVNAGTSSAVGDDLSISIRGFNSSETATMLDGHQIGPIGAEGGSSAVGGGGFDYQDSPFWGLRNTQVVFGSGATGIYGATTIAGAVDFQTIDPTLTPHGEVSFGVGNMGKSMTAGLTTGTFGKLGYAAAYGVQGTYGMFSPGVVPQTGLLGNNLTRANLASVTYGVSGAYTLRNSLLKLAYNFDPKTTLTLTGYSATSWDDKSGNGDTDNNTYQLLLYNVNQGLAQGPLAPITLPNGSQLSCGTSGVPVFADTPSGGKCLTPQQYAASASGPAGGGPSPWQAIRNQDYHGRFTTSFGSHLVTLDGYIDNYAVDYNRNVAGGFSTVCNCFTGFFRTNIYRTNGELAQDEFLTGKHDISFGINFQHQTHSGGQFGPTATDSAGNPTAYGITPYPDYLLNQTLYFARDQYQPSTRLSLFGDFTFNHTNVTNVTSFDPRLTVMYRPDPSDVIRVTGGHSNSVPDPALALQPVTFDTNYLALNPNCNGLTAIASGGNPSLKPETATDVDASYGRRFGNGSTVQLDLYNAHEQNALFAGTISIPQLGVNPSPAELAAYQQRISSFCPNLAGNVTTANLGSSTTYNAADATYKGVQLSASVVALRGLTLTGDYNIQSAVFQNVPDAILTSNPYVINGSQIQGVPLRKADGGVSYTNPLGIGVQVDGHFIDTNNGWNRPAFWYANASLSNTWGNTVLNIGINNVFNSNASQWGLIGLGTYNPTNAFNSSLSSALAQGSEEFGLPYRQVWLTITQKM